MADPITGADETGLPQTPVGEQLSALHPPAPTEVQGLNIDTLGRRERASVQGVIPWSEIEARPEFQNLSAHGKRLWKARYLADIEQWGQNNIKNDKDRGEYINATLSFIPDYKDPTRSLGDWLNDFNIAIQSGVASVTGSVGGVAKMLGIQQEGFEGDPLSRGNLFNEDAQEAAKKIWQGQKSLAAQDFQKFKAEREAAVRAEGGGEVAAGVATAKAYAARPGDFLLAFGEQIPIAASFIGPGGLIRAGTRLATGAPKAIETAVAALRAGKLTPEAAAAAIKGAEVAGTRAGQLYTGALGAALGSSDSKQQFVEAMTSVDDNAWMADPEFAAAVGAGEDPKAVKRRLAEDRAGWASALGAAAGVFSGITGFERLFIGPAVQGMRRRILSAAAEPLTESLENIVGLGAGNLQAQGLDPKRAMTQGFGPAIAEAVALSGPFAVAAGAFPGGPGRTAEALEALVAQPQPGAAATPTAPEGGPPGGPPPGGPGPTVGPPLPSAIDQARAAFQEAQTQLAEAERVRGDGTSTPQQVAEAEATITSSQARIDELNKFMAAWDDVPVVRELERANATDERRIAELEADQRADPDAKAREIGALQGRIEGRRALAEVNALNENDLQDYIDSREKSLAAADQQRGLGITVDKARLTNEIAHAQRLLEERAEIQTPAEIAFTEREPTVFQRDPAGVPIWPTSRQIEQLPFIDAMNAQRDKALSLINLVRGNQQFTRAQRTAAITQARAHYLSANRIAEAWTLPGEELDARRAELTQALGSGMTGATSLNQGHFLELAGVIATQAARQGKPMSYRQALLEAQRQIAAIYVPPTVLGPGSLTSQPKNAAGDTNKTFFYDDDPTIEGTRVLARTPTDPEKKLWNSAVAALAKLGFNKSALDALGIRIATSEYALGLYIPSVNPGTVPFTLSVSWAKHPNDQERQWTVIHEISHALADSQRNGTDISAGEPRFLPGGEFRRELEAAYQNGNGPMQKLDYPLNKGWGYSDAAIAQELWAQSTAYHFLDRATLKQHAPKTAAFIEAFYANLAANKFTTRQQVAAAVQAGFSGVPPAAAVPGGQPPTGGAGPAAPVTGAGPAGPQTPPGGPAVPAPTGVGPGGVLTPPTPTATPPAPKAAPKPKAPPAAPAPAPTPAAAAPATPVTPAIQQRFDDGVSAGQRAAQLNDPGFQNWRGFTAEDLSDAMESARAYFALPEGPARQAALSELLDATGAPMARDWDDVMGALAYRAGLSTGLGKPSATAADIMAAIDETQRIIDDAIESVEAAIEQESGAGAAGVQGPQPAGPAGEAAAVPGKPAAKGKRKKLKRPKVGGTQAAAPAAVAGPVRPAEVGGAKLRRPSDRAQAPRQQPAQAAEGRGAAQAAAPQVVAASSLRAGERVQDEFGNEVTVDSVEDGTVYVKGIEGFVYETTPFPLGSTVPGRRKRKVRAPKPQALEPGATTPAPVVTRDMKAGRELAERQIRWAIENARDLQRAMEAARKEMIGELMTAKQLGFQEAVDDIRQEILNISRAITAMKVRIGTLLDGLTQRKIISKVVGEPTTAARLEQILGRLFGIAPASVRKRLPRIFFARESEIGPDGRFALPGGRFAIVEAGTAAHYIPETNTITLFVDRIPKGKELGLILHELFHKRGGQLLGKGQMVRLMGEAMKWRDAPIGSPERTIYQNAVRRIYSAAGTLEGGKRAETIREETLPYFISEAVDQGYLPDVKNILAPGVKGWLARVWRTFSDALSRRFGRPIPAGNFGVNELMAAAWGAAQYELDAQQYEAVANGEQINPELPGDARARLALSSADVFAQRRAEMARGEGQFIPELQTAEERRAGVRGEGAVAAGPRQAQVNALNAAPKSQVVQAATAPPAVGPTNPAKSIVEMFKPSEARAIRTAEDLDSYMKTGNRPSLPWMQQMRDRQIENYVDHQRPFLAWLRRHALDMKAWAKLKLVPGRLKARSDAYQRAMLAPIERSIAAFAKANKIPQDQAALDAGWWATLQHIEEANAALRQKLVQALIAAEPNAAERLAHFDRTQRGALKPGESPAPMAGGLTNAKAAQAMLDLQARYPQQGSRDQLQKIADDIVAGFAKLKDDAVATGQISADALKNFPKFKRYVALTGPNQGIWDDQVSDGFGSYIAENRLREREGRTSSVSENSLEALAERVGRVSAYHASSEFKQELNNIYERAGGENNTIGLRRFVANMVQSPSRSDIVWNAPDGKRYVFRFDEAETIGESLLGKNREYHETIGLKIMDFLTRKFSRMVTQWIPAFGPINAIRDIQEKAILIRSREVKDSNGNEIDANQIFKRTWAYWLSPDLWRAARQLAFSPEKRAQENTAIGRYANELITEGGVSTWGEITRKGLASIEEAVRQEARRAGLGRGDLNSLQKVEDFVRNYNLMFEIASSLAVNAAMRDMNVAPKDAAFQTLDLMNFQNVGARAGWLRAAFAFFNPAAQSGYNLYRQIKSPRGRRDFFALLAFSFFLQGILRALADDDEELGNELDQRGTWEVERNVPVNVLGVPLKIPVGFGAPQFAWSITNSGYRWLSGRYDTADAVAQGGIAVLKSFNPVPISEVGPTKQPINFLLKTFTPTVFRPALDFITDSDAWGGKLTAYYPDKTKFRSEQGRPTTSVFYKDLAEGLQGLGMDLYPEQVKALGEAIAWGPFGYVLQGVADTNKENEGRRLNPMDKLPASAFLRFMGASRFVGGESRYLEARYYENYDRALDDLREFNRAKSEGREGQWRGEHPERMRRVTALQDQERTMRSLSKQFNTVVRDLQSEKMTVERARPVLERIQNQREGAMRKFLTNTRAWREEEDDE